MTYEINDNDYQDEDDLYYLNGMSYDLEDAREVRHNSLISKGFYVDTIADYVDEIYNNNNEGE
jgi:hypothetical protein|tara:strand:+ start:598 stop:786 length:189 start_codon:yes stop_codon:yes gene_type:complete